MTAPAPEATPQGDVVDPAVGAAAASTPVVDPPAQGDTTDWKAEARKHEARAKENAAAAKRLKEIEQAQMSEAEKAAEREREAEQLRTENLRLKAANLHGISDENMDLLGSGSEEEVLARAERLGEFEDAIIERDQLLAELETLKTTLGLPQPVTALNPGAPVVPDNTSYPASWFPQIRPAQNTNN